MRFGAGGFSRAVTNSVRGAQVNDICTIDDAAAAEDHNNCPIFELYPTPTTAATLKLWWIIKPIAMSAATDTPYVPYDCDELLILYGAARAWKANRNFDMHAAMWQEFMTELQKKVANYQEAMFKPVGYYPVG